LNIPFVDLKQQYALHQSAFEEAMRRVCAAAAFILGPEVERFEKDFAAFLEVKEAVGVANGTDALCLALEALGLGPGDEVLLPANTFVATAYAVHRVGATIVPVDVEPDTFLMDLTDAEKRLTPRTRAVIPVHLFGQACDMDALNAFAARHNLVVVEDAAQAHGARWAGRRVGGLSAAGCFSFYPGKNLGAFGDGGAVVTNDPALAEKLRLLRNYGSTKKYLHDLPAGNSRLDSVQAAVLNVKLAMLEDWNRSRFRAACRYNEGLRDVPGLTPPVFNQGNPARHVFHLYVIQSPRRDELLEHLGKNGVSAGIHYPVPIHLHRAYAYLGQGRGDCPVAEKLGDTILSLPMFPEITDQQVDAVIEVIRNFHG
jgi:dTDP-4-amino-4,6-dideoxygalactose transaminase